MTFKELVQNNFKEIGGAVAAGLATLAGAVTGDETFGDVTTNEWILVAIAVLGGFGITYAMPNNRNFDSNLKQGSADVSEPNA